MFRGHGHALANEGFRFLLAGAANTAASYALYLLLLGWLPPLPAYVAAYAAGIVLSYTLNALWVFRAGWTLRGLAAFPVVHAVQAILSIALFHLLVTRMGVPHQFAPLLVVAVTIPVTFLLARRVVRRRPSPPTSPDRSPT